MRGNNLKYPLLAAVILVGIFLVYGVHHIEYDRCDGCVSTLYPYPIHGDEWTHLAQGIYMMENGKIPDKNPYLSWQARTDLEAGFHAFLAQFFTLTGLDPVLNQRFLPAIFIAIYILSITLFTYGVTKNFFIGVISGIFLLLAKSNINIYGLWFFVPLIFSTAIIFLFLYTYLKTDMKALSAIFFLTSIAVYPLATIFITSILASYLAFNKRIKPLHICCAAALVALMVLLVRFDKVMSFLIFRSGWTKDFEVQYSLFQVYGIIGVLAAISGVYFLFNKQYNKILVMTLILPGFTMICYFLFKITLLIPYQRGLFYMLISLAPLSAIGVYHTLELIYRKMRCYFNQAITASVISIIVFALLVVSFYGYYHVEDDRFSPQHIVSDADYEALSWVKENRGTDNTIMVPGVLAFGIYPISQNQVYAMPESNLVGGNMQDIFSFYSSGCDTKKSIMDKGRNGIIYNKDRVYCDFLKEIYSKNGIHLYSAK